MIAANTSAVLHFLHGFEGPARILVRSALAAERLVLPPVVVTELLSGLHREPELADLLAGSTVVPLMEGYWERTGETRRRLQARGLRGRLADSLVAQACIDSGLPLIAGDTDFRHFAAHCGLKLAT